ncbi:OGG1 [Symbiodinium sp. CCMP2592]|nr:OGG1 [Symbiodinium sp. CCMP2592]CAE7666348.1 OGG1 [Symbiodinium sp. CCMP2592]
MSAVEASGDASAECVDAHATGIPEPALTGPPTAVVQSDTGESVAHPAVPVPVTDAVAPAAAVPSLLPPQQNPPGALQRVCTSDSITTCASTIATPPPNRPHPGSPPSSTEKLPLPADRKRAILQALESECATIEMLLKAKGDLAAKRAFEAARERVPEPSMGVDHIDTYPMDTGVAEDVLQAARIEVHQRELQQSVQEESQPKPELSADLRGTTLILGQVRPEPEQGEAEDDNRTVYFDAEDLAFPDDSRVAYEEPKPIEPSVATEEPSHEKPSETSMAIEEPSDEKPTEPLVAAEEPTDDEPSDEEASEASVAMEEPSDEKPSENLVATEDALLVAAEEPTNEEPSDEASEASVAMEEPSDEKPSENLVATEEPSDEKPIEPSDETPDELSVATEEPADEKRTEPPSESRGSVQPPLPMPACARHLAVVSPAEQSAGQAAKKESGKGRGRGRGRSKKGSGKGCGRGRGSSKKPGKGRGRSNKGSGKGRGKGRGRGCGVKASKPLPNEEALAGVPTRSRGRGRGRGRGSEGPDAMASEANGHEEGDDKLCNRKKGAVPKTKPKAEKPKKGSEVEETRKGSAKAKSRKAKPSDDEDTAARGECEEAEPKRKKGKRDQEVVAPVPKESVPNRKKGKRAQPAEEAAPEAAPKRKRGAAQPEEELTEEQKQKKQLKSRKSCAYHWARLNAINLGFSEEEAKKQGLQGHRVNEKMTCLVLFVLEHSSARGFRVATIDINRSPHMNMLSDAGFLCCEKIRQLLVEKGSFDKVELVVKQWQERKKTEEVAGGYVTKKTMADNAFKWAAPRGRCRKNIITGEEEADIPLDEKWQVKKEQGQRLEFETGCEMDDPNGSLLEETGFSGEDHLQDFAGSSEALPAVSDKCLALKTARIANDMTKSLESLQKIYDELLKKQALAATATTEDELTKMTG